MVQIGIRRLDRIEQIVTSNHHHADDGYPESGKVNEPRKHNHRPAQRPQHRKHRQAIIEIELNPQAAKNSDFEKDQPQASRKKESREFSFGFSFERKIGAGSGEQKENRRAKMGDPAGKKKSSGGLVKIGGADGAIAKEIADMIERHQDHDDATNDVDRFDAGAIRADGFDCRRHPSA